MRNTLPALVCAILVLSSSPRLHAQNANLAVESSRWPPFKAAIDGPVPAPKYNDPPAIKSVSLKQVAKYQKGNKFIRPEKLSVLSEETGYLQVMTRFQFAGPELESRRIELEVQAFDRSGQVLSKALVRCFDARIEAKKTTHVGPVILRSEPFNEPVVELQFPVGIEKSVTRVEVEFREPGIP